jgi:hypothetical protein
LTMCHLDPVKTNVARANRFANTGNGCPAMPLNPNPNCATAEITIVTVYPIMVQTAHRVWSAAMVLADHTAAAVNVQPVCAA